MSMQIKPLMIMSLASVFLFTGTAVYAEQADKPSDLSSHLCKDIMRLSGADRDIAIGVFHGYMLGKKNTTKYNTGKLAEITDNFEDHCLDNPKDKALDAFTKLSQ